MTRTIPRGIRNNNPCNIRVGNVWLGEVQNPTDSQFEQFVNMHYGLRATFVLLRRYIKHYKRNTLQSIIESWAPRLENDTEAYVMNVSKRAGIAPLQPILFEDKDTMCKLVDAMIVQECGQPVPFKDIEKGYEMA